MLHMATMGVKGLTTRWWRSCRNSATAFVSEKTRATGLTTGDWRISTCLAVLSQYQIRRTDGRKCCIIITCCIFERRRTGDKNKIKRNKKLSITEQRKSDPQWKQSWRNKGGDDAGDKSVINLTSQSRLQTVFSVRRFNKFITMLRYQLDRMKTYKSSANTAMCSYAVKPTSVIGQFDN